MDEHSNEWTQWHSTKYEKEYNGQSWVLLYVTKDDVK
jgi:hypothetical protein